MEGDEETEDEKDSAEAENLELAMISWASYVVKERGPLRRGNRMQGGKQRNWTQIYMSRALLTAVARLVKR